MKWKLTVVRESTTEFGQQLGDLSVPWNGAATIWEQLKGYCTKLDREEFLVIPFDNKYVPLGVHVASRGSVTQTMCHPREIFKVLLLANAVSFVVVHNHPSGDPQPSKDDLEITRRLREIGDLMAIRMVDHVIMGDKRYVSFVDDGYW
jgi:DNA repair protein RadC